MCIGVARGGNADLAPALVQWNLVYPHTLALMCFGCINEVCGLGNHE